MLYAITAAVLRKVKTHPGWEILGFKEGVYIIGSALSKGSALFGHAMVYHAERRLLYLNPKVLYLSLDDIEDPITFGAKLESEFSISMPPFGARDVRRLYWRPKHMHAHVLPYAGEYCV